MDLPADGILQSSIQAPEAPIDNRSLFEKLQEQKDLKEMQWQEEHAFKNNTFNKALEEDEAQFLDAVDAARQNKIHFIVHEYRPN